MSCWKKALKRDGSSDTMLKRWMGGERAEGQKKMSKTFFFAVFRNLLLRVFFRGQVTRDQNKRISGVKMAQSAVGRENNASWITDLQSSQKVVACTCLPTYCHGSKQISCPCLCPSSCSSGPCQWALLKEGKGLHLVYTPASNPQMQKWMLNETAFCWLM